MLIDIGGKSPYT